MEMSDQTWVLLQLFVAGCTWLLMWGLMRMASGVWNRFFHAQRLRAARGQRNSPPERRRERETAAR